MGQDEKNVTNVLKFLLLYECNAWPRHHCDIFGKNARILNATESIWNCDARESGRLSRAGREGAKGGSGGRQIRNEFFCFEHPAKRATREKTIPDCYPTVVSRGEPQRAAERRGKRAKRPFASAKPFLQPCMQPPRESQTWHTYASGRPCV